MASGRPSDRKRTFTPIDRESAGENRPLARLAPIAALIGTHPHPVDRQSARPSDDLEPSAPASAGVQPALVPNKAIPFLQRVHAESQPESLDRRLSSATRAIAITVLGIAVVVVITTSIALRAPAPQVRIQAPPSGPTAAAIDTVPSPATSPATSPAAVSDALATLKTFLAAPTHEARQALADSAMPLPHGPQPAGPLPALLGAQVQTDRIQPIQAGPLSVVLVPLTDAAGLPRTAALIHRGSQWRVDWRSVLTPETGAWEDFTSSPDASPGLFRVLIQRESDGTWTVARSASPEATRFPVALAPGSRAATELDDAIRAQNGRPLSADVYLTAQANRSLNILDWTRDKWSL